MHNHTCFCTESIEIMNQGVDLFLQMMIWNEKKMVFGHWNLPKQKTIEYYIDITKNFMYDQARGFLTGVLFRLPNVLRHEQCKGHLEICVEKFGLHCRALCSRRAAIRLLGHRNAGILLKEFWTHWVSNTCVFETQWNSGILTKADATNQSLRKTNYTQEKCRE